MPLYEYLCRDCGERFEVLQRMGEGAEGLACPKCDRSEIEKQFSTFASASSGNGSSREASGCGAPACGTGFT